MIAISLAAALLSFAHADEDGSFDHRHTALGTFLSGAVSTQGIDYGTLKGRRTTLEQYLKGVQSAETTTWSNREKLALYVNAYNAYTLQVMLDNGPPNSILDLDGGKVWDTRKFVVAGETLTLNEMEHQRARKLGDGRVHAVVNCASKGCPPLPPTPLTATGQTRQLDAATRAWAATNAFRIVGSRVEVSKIFDWYGEDFVSANQGDLAQAEGKQENALWFLSRYVDDATKAKLLSGSLQPAWQDYDWTLNQR